MEQMAAKLTSRFFTQKMTPEHVQIIMNLQKRVLDALPDGQQLVYEKTESDFMEILQDNHHYMIGIFTENGILVEKSAVFNPHTGDPDAHVGNIVLPGSINTVSTLCGSMVDPEGRGQNLMMKAVECWLQFMAQDGRHHAMTVINRNNGSCWNPFLKDGFRLVDVAHDPVDHEEIFVVHRDIQRNPYKDLHLENNFRKAVGIDAKIEIVTVETPYTDLKELFNKGYVGVAAERSADQKYTGNIIFVSRNNFC